ncbi:hypothetical protein [Psychrobacter sp. UBA2514]|jgi:GNAT superfamily N-acetyltransferase|uniref:hypothetical protein n=1 Tax=Psychrobacter sp. UBA2514 TaxID=1947346 RepID=UPI002579D89F|nr:hypothetical protein [Psychrobacter sp. UBA2514]|tara:strand:+ start:7416 stop:7838 length:423 start_codon:yes stop_codon:yes gene_type:complete
MIKQVKFADYQHKITSMMMEMLHLEPQPVDIPVRRYCELDDMGVLRAMLWFDGDMVKAVALLFVSPSLRNPMIVDASTDVLWVKPEHRGNSSEFISSIKAYLSDIGVNYWYVSSRDNAPIEGFLEKNNFEPLERLYFCEV